MMYVASKLFTYLFLPPGIFVFVLILAGFFAKRFKALFFTGAFALYLISIYPFASLLLKPLESFSKKEALNPSSVVFLGGGVFTRDKIHAAPDAFKREMYAILLAKKYSLPLVFTGGGKPNEAEWIKKDIDLITQTCGCKIKTFYESRSLNTFQNAKFTSTLFDSLNLPKDIYLVTNAYHMKRAYTLFKHFGFKITTMPVGYYSKNNFTFWDFFPNAGAFEASYKAIHEYFGILSLKLRGL